MQIFSFSTSRGKIKYLFLLLAFALCGYHGAYASLSGTYTIDPNKSPTSTNYTSFNDADSDLIYGSRASGGTTNGPGVGGAVIFNVADGTYSESVDIPYISGVSSTNTITFNGHKGDSSKVVVTAPCLGSYSTMGFVIHLDNASFVTLNELTLLLTSGGVSYANYDHALIIDNVSDSNIVMNCQLISPYSSTFTTYYGSALYSGYNPSTYTYSQDQYNTIYNNYMKGGEFGIYFSGNYTGGGAELGNVIDHNIIDSCEYYGMYIQVQDGVTITNNKINMPYNSQNYGLYMYYIGYSYYGASTTSLIANNFISESKAPYNYGLMAYYADLADIVYNNIYVDGGSSTYAGYIYSYSASTLDIYNNNFVNTNGYALYGYGFSDENYDNFYTGGSNLINYNGTNYADVATWISSNPSSFGANDISANPLYNSTTDLHVNNPALNGTANPLSYVTTDIDGDVRSTTTPDIGADEFTPPAVHPVVTAIANPASGFCVGTQDVDVTLYNFGLNTLTSVDIAWSVGGVAQPNFKWTGSLTSSNSITFKVGTFNFSSATTVYNVSSMPDSANGIAVTVTPYTTNVRSGMKGTFLIDNSGAGSPDYTSFKAAVADLNLKGTCGAVVFNVADGYYNESIQIGAVANSSATNTVTFQSKSLDSSKVTLDTAWSGYSTGTGCTVYLNGASNVIFNELTITNSNTTAYTDASAVELNGGANHIMLENNRITMSTSVYNYAGVVNDVYGSDENYINIQNNYIAGSYYSLMMEGSYGSPERGIVINHNQIDSAMGYGVMFEYVDSTTLSNNIIFVPNGYAAVYYYNYGGSTTDTTVIYNNFITNLSTNGNGMYCYYLNNANVYYNTIVNNSSSSFYYTAYFYNFVAPSSMNLWNNIFFNENGGTALYATSSAITGSNYNDLYSTGNVGSWSGTACATLLDWQTASSMDANSVSGDPMLKDISTGDLHLTSKSKVVKQKGTPIPGYDVDIDSQARSTTTPCIGADETKPVANDATVFSIDSPGVGFCSGTKNVYATISNVGLNNITSVTVNWSVGGTTKTSYSWTGTMKPGDVASIKLGSFSFPAATPENIVVWTSSPNGTTDGDPSNDTDQVVRGGALAGTFTIGGASPDFATFNAAAAALKNIGVCGATTFNVADGQYNESVHIPSISGASAVNTITFQSKSNDSTKVILDTAWTGSYGSAGYTLSLDGANYVTFREMTIVNTPTTSYNYTNVVDLTNKANHNTISNCVISTEPASGGYDYGSCVYDDPNSLDEYNTISHNEIDGGGYSVYVAGPYSSTAGEVGNTVYANTIDSSVEMGLYIGYQDSLMINANNISTASGYYAVYIYDNMGNGGADSTYFINNFVSITNTNGYAMYSFYNDMVNFYNNSFYSVSTASYYYTLYMYDYTTHVVNFLNNIVQNDGGSMALYEYGGAITNSDYNDWYTVGSTLASWAGSSCSTLSDLQTANSMDAHSVSGDAMFNSPSTGDLHLTSLSTIVMHVGTPLAAVKVDIDGQKRSAAPNIGADETKIFQFDAATIAIDSPAAGFCASTKNVYVKIMNAGAQTLTKVNIDWKVNGTSMTGTSWTGTLASGASTIVKLGSYTFASGTSYNVVAWTSKPDGVLDSNSSNDTLSRSVGASLTGTYTIGGVSPSFATFHDASTALNSQGVCGPVTFNVRDGYYNESVEIKSFPGSSAINTVTFQSQSLDSTKVILDTTTSGGYSSRGVTVKLNGATYVTFRKMTITNAGGSYTYDDVVQLTGKASYNTIENCVLTGNTSSYNYGSIIDDDAASVEQYNTIQYNEISGNYYTIYLGTPYNSPEFGNVIYHNSIDSGKEYGIYTYFQDSMSITNNNILEASAYYGIYLYYSQGVNGNDTNLIANNFITIQSSGYAIEAYYNTMLNIYSNSINTSGSYAYSVYLYHYTSSIVNVYNNSIVNDNGGPVFYSYNIGVTDYNNYYTTASTWGYWSGTSCSSLSDIMSATGYDAGSVSGDPYYNSTSTGDLHATSSSTIISNDGIPMSMVTTDYDGQKRSATKPDIGADEFGSDTADIGVSAILNPVSGGCGNSSTIVEVKVHNYGTKDQTTFNVYAKVTGSFTGSTSAAFSGTVKAGADATVFLSFSPALNTSAGGTIQVKSYTDLVGDADHTNDTTTSPSITINAQPKAKLWMTKYTVCAGDTFQVNDSSGMTGSPKYAYYLVDNSGTRLDSSFTGSSAKFVYSTPGTYRVKQGILGAGGCYDSTSRMITINPLPTAGFTYVGACPGSPVMFTNTSTTTSGTLTYSWDLEGGVKSTAKDTSNSYAVGAHTVYLTATANGCSSTISHSFSIDSAHSAFTYSLDTAGTISVKAIDTTLNLSSYSWNFGDGSAAVSGTFSTSHKYSANGKYPVTLSTDNGLGCSGSKTDSVAVVITGISYAEVLNGQLSVYPNPFTYQTNISYTLANAGQVKIEVMDVMGREVGTLVSGNQLAGNHNVVFSAGDYNSANAGIYVVRMTIGSYVINKQIILVK